MHLAGDTLTGQLERLQGACVVDVDLRVSSSTLLGKPGRTVLRSAMPPHSLAAVTVRCKCLHTF